MRIICLLIGIFVAVPAAAQPWHDVDLPSSVVSALDPAGSAMINEPATAFEAARRAELAGLAIGNDEKRLISLAYARWIGAEALLRLDFSGSAQRLALNAEVLAHRAKLKKLLGDVLMTRAGIFAAQSKSANALALYQEAYRAFQIAKNNRGQAIALQNIASLYVDGRDFDNAERYFKQSDEAYRDDPILSLTLYNNRANSLLFAERYDAALIEYDRALKLAEREGSPIFQARILGNMAKTLLEKKDAVGASRMVARAIAIVRRPEASGWYRPVAAIAAQAALQRRDTVRAFYWIEQAFDGIDPATTNITFRDAHSTAFEIYRSVGDTPKALAHLIALRRLTDIETKLAASTNTALMAARFDYANQELRIARLKADELSATVALQRSEANFQRTLTFGVIGGAAAIVSLLSIGLVTIGRSRNQVRAANVELGASNVALEKALAAKTEFLATTSHEIRTPLNGILGMTQVMLADRALPAAQRERVGIVHGAGLTMRALVDDILDVAKMETGNLSVAMEPSDLCQTLRDVAELWGEQAAAKGVAFEVSLDEAPKWVVTDAGRVRQIVLNLLSNALKFTASGSIGLHSAIDAGRERFTISVRDTGIGIPAAKHHEIFESFRQADSTTTRQFGGTGLGLTICRNLAQALGGSIEVASEVGVGSTFTVTLPLHDADVPTCREAGPTGGLLLIERNPIAQSMLRTLLAPRAGEVRVAAEIGDGLSLLAGASHLLVDAAMLGDTVSDQLEALRSVAVAAEEQSVSAFVLWKQPDDAVRALFEGMAAVTLVEKPIAGAALAALLFDGAGGNTALVTRAA